MCFIPIKQSLKRDLVKYEERAERARLNGAKGGRPKTQKTQSVISEPKKPDSDNVSVNVSDSVNVIVSYLNSRVGSSFKSSTDKTKRMINARLKEGFTVEDFKQVIETKAEEWENDPKFCKFLRPETLFSNKFESYLNQQQAGQSREDELKLHLLKHLQHVQSEDYIDEPTDANRMRRLS
jgi:uncharacterized phage protein (TIGR02220 family)